MTPELYEAIGQLVHEAGETFYKEATNASYTRTWDDISELDREACRQIGKAVLTYWIKQADAIPLWFRRDYLRQAINRERKLRAVAENLADTVTTYFNKRGVAHAERKGNEDIAAMADALSDYGYQRGKFPPTLPTPIAWKERSASFHQLDVALDALTRIMTKAAELDDQTIVQLARRAIVTIQGER